MLVQDYFLGRSNEAITAFKQAIQLQPESSSAHRYLGMTYHYQGKTLLALEEYKLLRELDYQESAKELLENIYPP